MVKVASVNLVDWGFNMIHSLTVTNYMGESLSIVLTRPWETGIAITDIDGIGPEKADLTVTEVTTINGGFYNYGRRPSREIVLKIKYYEHDGIFCEDIRQMTYKYFPLNQKIRLTFKTDNRHCAIEGVTQSNSPDIFDKSEGAQISIICPDPYFYAVTDEVGKNSEQQITTFQTVIPKFEFPFSNEYGIDPDGTIKESKNIIFGEVISKNIRSTVTYDGDGDEGILIRIHALGDFGDYAYIMIKNTITGEQMRLNIALKTGYTVEVCTIRGQKSAILYDPEGNFVSNVMQYVDSGSDWFVLAHGRNDFEYTAYRWELVQSAWLYNAVSEDVVVTIFNRTKYEGI